jgi:hypothetical protein
MTAMDNEHKTIMEAQLSKTGADRRHAFMEIGGPNVTFHPSLHKMTGAQWAFVYMLMNHLAYVPQVNLGEMSESDFQTLIAGTTFKNMATRVSAGQEAWESNMGEKLHHAIANTLGEQKDGGIRNAYCHIGQSEAYWAEQGRTGRTYTILPHVDREAAFYTRYMLTFTEDGGSRTFTFHNQAMGVSMYIEQRSGSATAMDEFSSGNSSWRHPSFARDRPHTQTKHSVLAGTAASVTFVFNMRGLPGEPLDPEGGHVMRQLRNTRQCSSLDSKPPKISGLSDSNHRPGGCKENAKRFSHEQNRRHGKRGGMARTAKKIEASRHNLHKTPTHNKQFLSKDKLIDLCVRFGIVCVEYNIVYNIV